MTAPSPLEQEAADLEIDIRAARQLAVQSDNKPLLNAAIQALWGITDIKDSYTPGRPRNTYLTMLMKKFAFLKGIANTHTCCATIPAEFNETDKIVNQGNHS